MANELKHEAVPIYLYADNCDHPEPEDYESPEWEEWASAHESGRDGEVLCMLTPLGDGCLACTQIEAEEKDLPEGEFVSCRLLGEDGSDE